MLTFPESSFSLLIQFAQLASSLPPRASAARIETNDFAPTDGKLPTGEPPPTYTMIPPRHADPLAVYPAFHAGLDAVVVAAPAKLNLFLEILRKRPDGYHDLQSLMLAVDLFDTLEVRAGPPGIISLTCEPPGLPTGPENLVVKAAHVLRDRMKRPDLGATIRLTKRIPTQAGLAGGSCRRGRNFAGLESNLETGADTR